MRFFSLLGVMTALLMVCSDAAQGFSSYINYLPNGSVHSCSNCHVNPNGGGTRNAFGVDVRNNRLNSVPNWVVLAALDSDGDGFTNGEELGDPCGCWSRGKHPMFNMDITLPGDGSNVPAVHTLLTCTGVCETPDAGPPPDGGSAAATSSSSAAASDSSGSTGCGSCGNSASGNTAPSASLGLLGLLAYGLYRRGKR